MVRSYIQRRHATNVWLEKILLSSWGQWCIFPFRSMHLRNMKRHAALALPQLPHHVWLSVVEVFTIQKNKIKTTKERKKIISFRETNYGLSCSLDELVNVVNGNYHNHGQNDNRESRDEARQNNALFCTIRSFRRWIGGFQMQSKISLEGKNKI